MFRVTGKYANIAQYAAARVARTVLRRRIADLVEWPTSPPDAPGCTAIIGMCHRLPGVIEANLACLRDNAWPELRGVTVVVDATRGALPHGFEARIAAAAAPLATTVLYYSDRQARVADRTCLPYVYAWLSWCIGLAACTTRTALLHDYDALVLDGRLGQRYRDFAGSGQKMQGIRWYHNNGFVEADRMATTFEAFVDVPWLQREPPIAAFSQVGRMNGRTVDFDTLLDLQARTLSTEERGVAPMEEASLVHPSQMIHQFTVARRRPGARVPVYSIPMIPFFEWLGGDAGAIRRATDRIAGADGTVVRFFDDMPVNFATLRTESVDWCLKQMVQAAVARKIAPFRDLHDYGSALYRLAGAEPGAVWRGHFSEEQRTWIRAAGMDGADRTLSALSRPG